MKTLNFFAGLNFLAQIRPSKFTSLYSVLDELRRSYATPSTGMENPITIFTYISHSQEKEIEVELNRLLKHRRVFLKMSTCVPGIAHNRSESFGTELAITKKINLLTLSKTSPRRRTLRHNCLREQQRLNARKKCFSVQIIPEQRTKVV